MMPASATNFKAAQMQITCSNLQVALDFFLDQLGFRVDVIYPADAPSTAVVSGFGVRLRLQQAWSTPAVPVLLHLFCDKEFLSAQATSQMQGPDGIVVQLHEYFAPLVIPETQQEWVLSRHAGKDVWHTGRAGLEYRDLIPSRLGGAFVASQIRVPHGGPVPDYVHFHKVRFQMIYCKSGWVKVVYEDQGEPFILQAGDCVLQPPEIRHRVLEASEGMEVIEIGCPAIHETIADHVMVLPTSNLLSLRDFSGQRFVRHQTALADWKPWRLVGFEARDIGIAAATDRLAGVQVIRPVHDYADTLVSDQHVGELMFWFVLQGSLTLNRPRLGAVILQTGDSCVLPSGTEFSLSAQSDLELLEVTLPARF